MCIRDSSNVSWIPSDTLIAACLSFSEAFEVHLREPNKSPNATGTPQRQAIAKRQS